MVNLAVDINFVKEQISAQEKMMQKYAEQPHRASLHSNTKIRFEQLLVKMIAAQSALDDASASSASTSAQNGGFHGVHLTLSDIEDVPDELMGELSLSESDRQEMLIADIISGYGGVASLDKILVALYKRSNAIMKRNTLTSKLFRMVEKKMIHNVPGKRGIYSSYQISDEDAERLFGKTGENTQGEVALSAPLSPAMAAAIVRDRVIGNLPRRVARTRMVSDGDD